MTTPEPGRDLDALFVSYFEDIDRWDNDPPLDVAARRESGDDRGDRVIRRRRRDQSVGIVGRERPLDFSRFLSVLGHGDTAEYRRYDAFTPTHLSGSYYESLLVGHGYSVVHLNHATRPDLEALRRAFTPRFVLISSTFFTERETLGDCISTVRRVWPRARIVVGGLVLVEQHKSVSEKIFHAWLLQWGADAYVVSPRAEAQLLAILARDPDDLPKIDLPSTWVLRGDRYHCGAGDDLSVPIDEHFIRWTRLDPSGLYPLVHTRTARSCAFACSFCSYFGNQGPLTLEAPETLEAELRELVANGAARSIVFTDDTFNVPLRRFKELLKVLERYPFEWYSFFRAQYADDDTAARMRDAGCRGVFMGIESIDDRVLVNMNKKATAKAYADGIDRLKRQDIACHANFIVGFPGDVPENADKVVAFCDAHDVDSFTMTPWYCSPATPIWQELEKFGVRGRFWIWKHDTMDSATALDIETAAIHAGSRTGYLSEVSAQSGWTLFLMVANGLDLPERRSVVRLFDRWCGRTSTWAEIEADPDVALVRAMLAERPFAPAPPLPSAPPVRAAAAPPSPPGGLRPSSTRVQP